MLSFGNSQESFYCTNYQEVENTDGCHLKCPEGQTVLIDPEDKSWRCVPANKGRCWPGMLQTGCDIDASESNCKCDGHILVGRFFISKHLGPAGYRTEIRQQVSNDCKTIFFCSGSGTEGTFVTCPEGQIVHAEPGTPDGYVCVEDAGQCHGAFSYGECRDGSERQSMSTVLIAAAVVMQIIRNALL